MRTTSALIDLLTPYTVPGLEMERWGSSGDGGYVVPAEVLKKIDVLITGGVSNDVHFEEDLARYNPKAKMGLFDHTIAATPDHTPAHAVWHKLGLGSAPMCVSLEEAAEISGAGPNDLLGVKFDIEFAEWELLEATPVEFWDRVAILITEYHGFRELQNWQRYHAALARLEKSLLPVHMHANNWTPTIRLAGEGVEFPGSIEATYINRKFIPAGVVPEPWRTQAPTKLDARNRQMFMDIRLDYWKPRDALIRNMLSPMTSLIMPWRVRKNIVYSFDKLLPRSLRSFD